MEPTKKMKYKYGKRKCAWCGRTFYKPQRNTKYCGDKCRKHANNEKNRIRVQNYRNKYHKKSIGTGYIAGTPHYEEIIEIKTIKNEFRRLNIKKE